MKVYSTAFLLAFLSVSCTQGPNSQQSNLAEANNYNNSRAYSRTIDLLENDSSLSLEERKALIHAYAGAAGLEANVVQKDIKKVEAILDNKDLADTDKVREILKILPEHDKLRLERLDAAIKLFEESQANGNLVDADSKFQLGVLYFYRSIYNTSVMFQFLDEGIAQKLEYKLSDTQYDTVLDFFNTNIATTTKDLGRSYKQLSTSYPKIKKIADKLDKTFNFFLSDKKFELAVSNDFKRITDLFKSYLGDVETGYDKYFNELDKIALSLGLEQTAKDIFAELKNNPEKVDRVLARIEMTIRMFVESSQDRHSEEFKYFNDVFPIELKEEFKVKVAESWRAKSTSPISDWLSSNDSSIKKVRDLFALMVQDAKQGGLENTVAAEVKILVDMLDKKAMDKLGTDLEIFNSLEDKPQEDLEKELDRLEGEYEVKFDEANGLLDKTLQEKVDKFQKEIGDEEIEFTEEEKSRMNKQTDKAVDILDGK